MFGVSRAKSEPFQFSQQIKILIQTQPSCLKSLARKSVRKFYFRKKSLCDKKLINRLEMANMSSLIHYLDFR